MDAEAPFRDQLIASGLLIDTGVDGLYGRSGAFERVVDALDLLISRLGAGSNAEIMRFPPGSNRAQFERNGYLKAFPRQAGTVHCFCGDERDHGNVLRCVEAGLDWTGQQAASDIVLTPAACYPVYPTIAARGRLQDEGALVDVSSYCFRHEPSLEPTRQQMFRMREYVRIGTSEQTLAFRQHWLERVEIVAHSLDLPFTIGIASDPFFGRCNRVLGDGQGRHTPKYELLIPVNSMSSQTSCTSFNYHGCHFGNAWELRMPDGSVAHSACIGFGLERLALALFRHHGLRAAGWPKAVWGMLWP